MLTYLFGAVFINLYFKTKHSNETFHLGFYSFFNVFSYRKHISSKSNISVLTISGKSRNITIVALSLPFYYQGPHFMVYSQYSLRVILLWPPLILRYFFRTPTSPPAYSTPLTIKHRRLTLFGLIRRSAEPSPQMLEKGFSNYYVNTSHPPTSVTFAPTM